MSMHRERTRRIRIGDERTGIVEVGGGAPVALQTMTTSFTHDVEASVAEITGCTPRSDIVRVAVPEKKDTERCQKSSAAPACPSWPTCTSTNAPLRPWKGVHKIRLNPGNISDRVQVEAVIDACKDRGIPIRIGVNEGSIIERRTNKCGPKSWAGSSASTATAKCWL